mgnify:CR=1 FL=1
MLLDLIPQRLISWVKYRFDTKFASPSDLDLDNFIQFLSGNSKVDLNLYRKSGVLVVKDLFSQEQLDGWRDAALYDVKRDLFKSCFDGKDYWLTNLENFSSGAEIVASAGILAILNQLIGPKHVFCGHDSVSINYSVPGLHDDQNTYRQLFGDEYAPDVKTVRVLFNLNSSFSMPQRFGFVAGSHKRDTQKIDHKYCEKNIKWVEVSHGSAIFFDPRVVHSADPLTHSKCMVVLTYDEEKDEVAKVFKYTHENRGQGVGPKAKIWSEIEHHGLKPDFIKSPYE